MMSELKYQRSDTLRYLLLLVEGGIYSDTDTQLLQPPSDRPLTAYSPRSYQVGRRFICKGIQVDVALVGDRIQV